MIKLAVAIILVGSSAVCQIPRTIAVTGGGTTVVPTQVQNQGDFWVERTSNTVLTIGPGCGVAPDDCLLTFVGNMTDIVIPSTATIASGTDDTAYVYLTSAGVMTVGTNTMGINCSHCTAITGITAFPANTSPLWTWTAVGGAWTAGGVGNVQFITNNGTPQTHTISFSIDGGGSAIATGALGTFPTVPPLANGGFSCNIVGATLTSDVSGSITIDVWNRSGGIPTATNKISASAPLTLSSSNYSNNQNISTWSKSVNPGSTFGFTVVTAATLTRATGTIYCQ